MYSTKRGIPPVQKSDGAGTPPAPGASPSMMQLPIGAYQTSVSVCPVCKKELASAKGLGPHVRATHPDIHTTTERIRNDFNANPDDVLNALHNAAGLTVQEISERFGYHREQIAESFELLGVERDDRPGLQQNWEDRPEEARMWNKTNASLGAAGRKKNGMKGVTGQDHPNWRGGKSLYHAIVAQLPGPSWRTLRKQHRGNDCEMCGSSDRELHLHHIVPVLSGGTNEPWNFLTLCQECHTAVEWRTREFADPVLAE